MPENAYLQGQALLLKDYDKIGSEDSIKMGSLLFEEASRRRKEAILMILAHQPSEAALTFLARYCLSSDNGLECFAEMALEECAMRNE